MHEASEDSPLSLTKFVEETLREQGVGNYKRGDQEAGSKGAQTFLGQTIALIICIFTLTIPIFIPRKRGLR